MLKAYFARFEGEEWGTLIHGETRGKCKSRFMRCNPMGSPDPDSFQDIRLKRVSGLDGKPFTFENAVAANFWFYDEDGETKIEDPKEFGFPDCDCEICQGEKHGR
jgi:hypothetical protein